MFDLNTSFLDKDELERSRAIDNNAWQILVVDEEQSIHDVSQWILKGHYFDARPIQVTTACSFAEARCLLEQENDFNLILLNLTDDKEKTAIALIKHLRTKLGNDLVKIIVRASHLQTPNMSHAVAEFGIDDYQEKTELNAGKLCLSVDRALDAFKSHTPKLNRPYLQLESVLNIYWLSPSILLY